jgi:hypothetical protein
MMNTYFWFMSEITLETHVQVTLTNFLPNVFNISKWITCNRNQTDPHVSLKTAALNIKDNTLFLF